MTSSTIDVYCVTCGEDGQADAATGRCVRCGRQTIRTTRETLAVGQQLLRWALKYDRCVGCGTTEKRHASHGLCVNCQGKPANRRSVA